MLGARLARRIALPLLLGIGGLFVLLGLASAAIADARVSSELETQADRIGRTVAGLRIAPEHRPEILPALARLLDCELVVGDYATRPAWGAAERSKLADGSVSIGGEEFFAYARPAGRAGERCFVLFSAERVRERRRDVLMPVTIAGTLGLAVALVLCLLVARTIARPVRRLAESVKRLARGADPEPGGGPRGPGEIGELEEAFERMVRELRASKRKLRESERLAALGRLAGGIAHELRNPLTAIRMAVETATSPPDAQEARAVALGEIDRLDRTLRELLDYARPRAPRMRDVDVGELFDEVATLLEPQCRHLRVLLEAEAGPGARVRADPDRLKQALLNLVLNGAQAQPEGGRVRLRGGAGYVEVEDEGPGVPEDVRANLFEPFVTTRAAGIGLGLAVVRQVADEHGARLTHRRDGERTVFRIEFGA